MQKIRSFSLALLLAVVYWAPLARVLSLADPGASGWALAVGMSLVPLLVGQLALRSRSAPGELTFVSPAPDSLPTRVARGRDTPQLVPPGPETGPGA